MKHSFTYYRLEVQRRRILFAAIHEKKHKNDSLELIVETEESKKDETASFLDRVGKVTHVFDFVPYVSFICEAKDAERVVTNDLRHIKSVDLSNRVTLPKPLNIQKTTKQELWNLIDIGAYNAREMSTGRGAKIGIIDSGIDYNHPEVSSCFSGKKGYDFVNHEDPMDMNGHGTHVAGIAAGINCGIAIDSTLYALRVLDASGSGSEADTMAAIEWCLKNDIDVANMSLGAPVASRAFEELCYYAASQGLILVAAAGNSQTPSYPAAFNEPVIAVAAVDRENRHAYFSNIYYTNDISAPGVDIVSSYLGGYASLSGTSMAAPHATGSIALAVPLTRNESLEYILEDTALNLGEKDIFGAGLVKADGLLAAITTKHGSKRSLLETIKEVLW